MTYIIHNFRIWKVINTKQSAIPGYFNCTICELGNEITLLCKDTEIFSGELEAYCRLQHELIAHSLFVEAKISELKC